MTPDPNLLDLQKQLGYYLRASWVLFGLAVGGCVLYFVISGIFSRVFSLSIASHLPAVFGLTMITVASVLQIVFLRAATRSFPEEQGLRFKMGFGVAGVGLLGVIIAAGWSLGVQLFTGEKDPLFSALLFGLVVLVCAPLTGFAIDLSLKLVRLERKYGAGGVRQLLEFQRYHAGVSDTHH